MSSFIRATACRLLIVCPLIFAFEGHAHATNLSPLIARLSSQNAGDRIAALRGLGRTGLGPQRVRVLITPLVHDPNPAVRLELVRTVEELLGDSGVDLLDQLFKDRQRDVRAGAVRASCRMWDRSRARAMCASAFRKPSAGLRVEVLRTLRQHFPRDPRASELFRRGLSDAHPVVQKAAVFGCQAARDPAAVADLLSVARTAPDLAAVPAAQEALPTIGGPEAIRALLSLIGSSAPAEGGAERPSAPVRAAAAGALARMRVVEAAPAIRTMLDEGDVMLRLAAIDALLQMRDRGSVAAISRMLADRDVRVRRLALRALRNIGDPSCAENVRRVMTRDGEAIVRATAVLTYADVLGRQAIPALSQLHDDPDVAVRLEAAGALAGMGRPACRSLASFVRDKSAEVRALAVSGIGQTRDASQIPALADAVRAGGLQNLRVRVEVAKALGTIGDPQGLPLLFRLAQDDNPNVRASAASSIGSIGGANTVAVLERLSRDPAPRVRVAAFRALRKVDGTPR